MNPPADPGGDSTDPDHRAPSIGGLATFTPLALSGSLGWVRVAAPQAVPREACLAITAYIHLMRPDVPLKYLDAQAEGRSARWKKGPPASTSSTSATASTWTAR